MPERALRHEGSPFDQWQQAPRARSPIRPKGLIEGLGVTALSSRRGLRPRLFEAHRDCAHRREVVGASAEGRLRARDWKALHFPFHGTERREASATPGQSASRDSSREERKRIWRGEATGNGESLVLSKGKPRLDPAPPDLFDRTGFPAEASHFGYCSPLLRGPLARAKLLEGQKLPRAARKSGSQE